MKIKSRVYAQSTLNFNSGLVTFVNGEAEVTEELYNEIVERKFPNIFKEGEEPEYRTKFEDQLRKDVKEGNKEYEEEIQRLKNVIDAQKEEIGRKDNEILSWKKAVEDLKAEYDAFKAKVSVAPVVETPNEEKSENSTEELSEEDKIRKDLATMKKENIKNLALTEEGGSFTEEEMKGKTKEEIIDLMMSKLFV